MNSAKSVPGAGRRVLVAQLVVLAMLLGGCASRAENGEPGHRFGERSWDSLRTEIQLAEPAANEVVVVINNNAALGNHAGIFAGERLSDPAGSYKNVRARSPDWQRVSLADYVAYQMDDGLRIQIYRFTLSERQFSDVVARLPEADSALPLFCGAAVQNALAGIGPFAGIDATWWTSPAELARRLEPLTGGAKAVGVCLWPDGLPC